MPHNHFEPRLELDWRGGEESVVAADHDESRAGVRQCDRASQTLAWVTFDSIRSYLVDVPAFRGGIAVAAGDFDNDGWDELATGRASGGSAVSITDPNMVSGLRSLPLRGGSPYGRVRVAAIPDGPGHDLLVGNGPGTALQLDRYSDVNADPITLLGPVPSRAYGIQVG